MSASKTYLNVPYAQKDEAKALGARWDAANKKWYAPADKDISLFAKWQSASAMPKSPAATKAKPRSQASPSKTGASSNDAASGVITRPSITDFAAYNGDAPPWD